jgi:hypothetical protein
LLRWLLAGQVRKDVLRLKNHLETQAHRCGASPQRAGA